MTKAIHQEVFYRLQMSGDWLKNNTHSAKLSYDNIKDIKLLLKAEILNNSKIAKLFNVSTRCIRDVKNNVYPMYQRVAI